MTMGRSRRQQVPVLLAATLALQSCSWMNDDCTLVGRAAVNAYVSDASTKGIPTSTPTLILVDGAYREEVSTPFPGSNPLNYAAGLERPGRYQVTVRADGYWTFVQNDVVVRRRSQCNYLGGVRLDVALVKVN